MKQEEVGKDRAGKRSKLLDYTTIPVGVLFSGFYIYEAIFGIWNTYYHRAFYLIFTGVMIFLIYPGRGKGEKKKISILDLILIVALIVSMVYWMYSFMDLATVRFGEPNRWDLTFYSIIIILCFEMARRVLGYVLPALALLLLLYCYFGPFIPGYWGHSGFMVSEIIYFMGTMESIFGFVINAYASYVILFVVFAAFLESTGAGLFLIEFANSVAGRYRGGPAKVAVISSALVGSIMGSSVSNVATTGSFTIPMMIRKGYKPHVAGAIESAASVGGQFMPPVMGAGAFVIAAVTGTRYIELIKMAAIPAILYFMFVMFMVHLEAVKTGVQRLAPEEIPPIRETITKGGLLLIPLVVIVFILLKGHTPNRSAVGGIVSLIFLGLINKDLRISFKECILALANGAKNSLTVGATAGIIGMVVGSVTLSGLAIKFSDAVISLTGGSLFLTLVFVGLTCYFLGMSMTVVADYLVVSVIAVPTLSALGVPVVAAHLLVFWLVNSSAVTPPVCLCAFTAATIAKTDPMRTGLSSLKTSSALFITPFIFVYMPSILYGSFFERCFIGLLIALGFIVITMGLQGFFIPRTFIKLFEFKEKPA